MDDLKCFSKSSKVSHVNFPTRHQSKEQNDYSFSRCIAIYLKIKNDAWAKMLIPIILAIPEMEIGRIMVQVQPVKEENEIPSQQINWEW
jgi:hypothetical protein